MSYVLINEPPKTSSAMNIDNLEESPVQVAKPQAVNEPTKPQPAKKKATVVKPAPKPKPQLSTCATEIAKYDWNQTVAYQVMMAESGNNHSIVNDNPSTGDYSVGCFQVNLYGNLRYSRPSENWLKIPANNVAYAYGLYNANGWSPWGATTCKYKVSCY